MSAVIARHKFTAEEYYRLYETAILDEHDRIELLDGDLNLMQAIGSRHMIALENLNFELVELSRRRFMISPQNPLELDQLSVPQPDLMLFPFKPRRKGPNKAANMLLVVEISDSSLRYDRDVKLPFYARAGIPEYWILNLIDDVVEIYRQPDGDAYRERTVAGLGETIAPLAFPDVILSVSAIVPER